MMLTKDDKETIAHIAILPILFNKTADMIALIILEKARAVNRSPKTGPKFLVPNVWAVMDGNIAKVPA